MKNLYLNKEQASIILLLRAPLNGRYESGSFFVIEESPIILENSVYLAELDYLLNIEEYISPHQLNQFATLPNCQLCFREEFTTSIEATIAGIKKLVFQYKIDPKNIWLTVSFAHEKQRLDNDLNADYIFGVNIQVYNFFLKTIYDQYLGNINYFEKLNRPKEQKRFSVFARRYDNARFYFFAKLVTENIIDDCCYTFTNFHPELKSYPDPWVTKNELQNSDIVKNYTGTKLNLIHHWINGLPYCLDTNDLRESFPLKIYDMYAKARVNIVIESRYKENKIMITEKTYKTIVSKKPFLMIAPMGSLKLLRKEGFESFSRLFNEIYDDIDEHTLKVKFIIAEMKKLKNLSNSEFDTEIAKLDELATYNFNRFMSLGQLTHECTTLKDLDLI